MKNAPIGAVCAEPDDLARDALNSKPKDPPMTGELEESVAQRPLWRLLAEMTDVADWIERSKPQGVLYTSALPSLREATRALQAAEARALSAEADRDALKAEMDATRLALREFDHTDGDESLSETAAVAVSAFRRAVHRAETAEARTRAAEALVARLSVILTGIAHTWLDGTGEAWNDPPYSDARRAAKEGLEILAKGGEA